jgi:ABC-type amino acid transport substrate-binding protein
VTQPVRRVPEPTYPTFTRDELAGRIDRARPELDRLGIDLLLLTGRENIVRHGERLRAADAAECVRIVADSRRMRVNSTTEMEGRGMRLRSLTLVVVLAGAIAVAVAGGSSAATPNLELVHSGQLTVATFGNGFPTIVIGKNGTLGGTSGAWLNAFAKANGLKVKLFQTTFTSAILAVQQGKADVTLDIYYTPERSKTLLYTYPFSVEGLQVFTKKSFPYSGPSSLKGHKVAAVTGVVWDDFLKKSFGTDLQLYPSQAEAATAFLNGQVDAYFEADAQYFAPPINKSPDVTPHNLKPGQYSVPAGYTKGYGYVVVNCKGKNLTKALNSELASLETSGEWAKILAAAGAPVGTLAAQVPPRTSPKQGC